MMELIKCADYAMYGIKKSEKGRFGVFDRAQYERAEKKIKERETQQMGNISLLLIKHAYMPLTETKRATRIWVCMAGI